ncbi:hypothetical protein [Streptomyces sp. NPDC058629]|uniref:hypothetical protein n=1 Tax=Streptomyces sp. NPDC058629 TaxID=3346565 RepID=UPI00366167D5
MAGRARPRGCLPPALGLLALPVLPLLLGGALGTALFLAVAAAAMRVASPRGVTR